MMRALLATCLLAAAFSPNANAQWGVKWLQDEAYWGDGKAEFNLYEAREVRYGTPRPSFILHILVREAFAGDELVKAVDPKQSGAYPVIKLNQVLYIPTGIYTYQQMHSAFWKAETGQLVKASLSSNDSIGNTYKELQALAGWRTWFSAGWNYHWHTYWQGMTRGETAVKGERDATFYDELPMRVRTIDFTPGEGAFAIPLAQSIINAKRDDFAFAPMTVSWRQRRGGPDAIAKGTGGAITVTVSPRDKKGDDVFILDGKPPHLLREWQKADGGSLKLKRSLKIDYWNYNKLGDQEKLLSDLFEPPAGAEHSHRQPPEEFFLEPRVAPEGEPKDDE